MSDIKTIAKSRTKAVDHIFTTAAGCRCFTSTNPLGYPCSPAIAKQDLYQFSFAKLKQIDGRYEVWVHSNLWYALQHLPS